MAIINNAAMNIGVHVYFQNSVFGYVPRSGIDGLLIIREMQIKTTVRYHLIRVRMAIIKSLQITNVGKDVEKREPSCTVGGNVN